MHEYLHVLVESLIETAKILPFLFIIYYLIELFEYKCATKLQKNKMLKGNASPIFGSVVGIIPQCGFSVISTDLFSKGALSVGALIAVYIATSDEAIPLMIAKPEAMPWLVALILIKLVFAILIGYLSFVMYRLIFKKKLTKQYPVHDDEHDHHEEEEIVHGGCCNHNVESKTFDWLHPLLHCLKISVFVLVINFVFSCITHIWIGEEQLAQFLTGSKFVQPVLAILVGLIPNCAASVVLTEMFLVGGLSFGALVSGLCVNAGLGLVVLFKQNKNWKENLFIILMLIISSLLLGYALLFI